MTSEAVGPNGPVTQISPMSTNSPFDDRMVLAGNFTTWNGAPCGYMVRLNTNGTLDTTFTSGGTGADDRIMNMNWFSDGTGGLIYGYFRSYKRPTPGAASPASMPTAASIAAMPTSPPTPAVPAWCTPWRPKATARSSSAADFNGVGGKYRGGFARLNPDGSLDTSFKAAVDGWVEGVALQADGKILVAGNFGQCQGYARTSLARLNPDGSLDTAFNPRLGAGDNPWIIVHQVVPLSNGQIMITGYIDATTLRSPAARLNSDGSLDPGFDASRFQHPREPNGS